MEEGLTYEAGGCDLTTGGGRDNEITHMHWNVCLTMNHKTHIISKSFFAFKVCSRS